MHCPRCGSPLEDDASLCEICGYFLKGSPGASHSTANILDDRYEILQRLETGAMGVLYRVRDRRLDRAYALKEMKITFPDQVQRDQAAEWFRREARILCSLRHPNIPVVTDFFTHGDSYFLVMDYIDGISLGNMNLPLSEGEVLDLCLTALDILKYIHGKNIIHRDIKTNHFIKENENAKYFLVDFGTARPLEPGKKLTAIGTQGFASPEHYEGKADFRSDIYSLGAVLHHILTGRDPRNRAPFDFEPVMKLTPGISSRLGRAVDKALAYKPEDRFQSAADMERFLAGPGHSGISGVALPGLEAPSYNEIKRPGKTTTPLPATPATRPMAPVKEGDPLKRLLGGEPRYDSYKSSSRSGKGVLSVSGERLLNKVYRSFHLPHLGMAARVKFLPPGDTVVVAYCEGEIVFWDIHSGEQVGMISRTSTYSSALCNDIAVTPDGSLIAQAMDNDRIIIWNSRTFSKTTTLSGHDRSVTRLCFRSNRILISGSKDETVRIWDLDFSGEKIVLEGHHGGVTALAVSPDDRVMIAGCGSGEMKTWEMHCLGDRMIKPDTEKAHRGEVRDIAFSGTSARVFSAGRDSQVRSWNLHRKHPVYLKADKDVTQYGGSVNTVACHPANDIFVTGGGDGLVRLWKEKDFKIFQSLREHSGPVISAAFSPCGRYLITASEDGITLVFA